MKILYVYRTKRKENFKNVKKGLEPDHILYGFNYIKNKGYSVNFSDVAYRYKMPLHFLILLIEKTLINVTSIGFKLDQAILLYPLLIKSDIIVTTADSAGLPILLFKKIGILKKRLFYISTGLINELEARKTNFIYKPYISFLDTADLIICHSQIEKNIYKKLMPNSEDKIVFIPFGIDANYFRNKKKLKSSKGSFIFSTGRDKSRDYNLLAKVAKEFKSEKFVVVTSKSNIKDIDFPPNVHLYFDYPYSKVKKFYLESKLIFIPLKEIRRASGQMSFLEGLASGKKIVIGKVNGINDSYPDLINKKTVFSYKPESITDASFQLRRALKSTDKDYKLERKYNSENYANKIINLIREYA